MPKTRRSLPKKMYSENANGAPGSGRLCEEDVRKIFACVKEGRVPTGDIAFNIVKATDKKLMLSPPSFEFRDGIYVFLRNLSDSNDAAVPPNLKHLVINDNDIESLKFCKWSLSGPASKSQEKGSVQQRYSYPRGRPEYSNTKGGSMWTMIDATGKDGLDIRVFHVYHSLKRLSSGSGSGSGSGGISGGSSDWSTNSVKNVRSRSKDKALPPKKRIKMDEDERVAQINSARHHPNKMPKLEDGTIDVLMRDQIGSPEITSFDLDTSLKISEVFGEDADNGYSFVPLPSASSFLTGSNMEPIPVSAHSLYYHPTPSYNNDGMDSVAPPPLSYSYDTPSQRNPSIGRPLSLLAFSNKLYQLQDCIFNDISATQSTEEQVQKLAVLQHWAKVTAQRPLHPNEFAPVEKSSSPPPANIPPPPPGVPIPEVAVSEAKTKAGDADPRITP